MGRNLLHALSVAGVAVGVSAHAFMNAPGLRRQSSTPAYDINAGHDMQVQTSAESATNLTYTTENGAVHQNPYAYERIGQNGMLPQTHRVCNALLSCVIGPLLLQDYHLTEMYGSFNRERIPERVVHARGGAFLPQS